MDISQPAYAYLNINDPLVAWLVYRGEMVSAPQAHDRAVSIWTATRLKNQAYYQRELVIEHMRLQLYTQAVSRLAGFYVFADKASAKAAVERWGIAHFRPEFLVEVHIDPESNVSRYDAEWITHCFESPTTEWIHDYLQGKPTDSPIWELVIDGRAIIAGTSLRQRAYDVVASTWPESLALLELARVGVELHSDIGLITAMIMGTANSPRIEYAMNFEDATNQAFLDRFSQFKGPKNTKDLTPTSDLVLPDLGSRGFRLR